MIQYLYVRVECYDKESMKPLNKLLEEGWVPLREQYCGGYSHNGYLYVLLQRKIQKAEVEFEDADESNGNDRKELTQQKEPPYLHS